MKVYAGAPAGARRYLEADRGRVDDYYLSEGTGIARRFAAGPEGPLAELAPLGGDAYESWVAGLDPATGAPRGRLRTDDRAVRFVEVVVNGPKSWSLAAALHPDIAAAYDAAQDRAATEIVGWLARHATTRVGPAGGQVQVPVERLEAVTVRHYTSRAGDPHRHLHLQINARVFAAAKWRGLHTVGVRDSLAAINGIGHAAVATDAQFRTALAAHGYTLNATGEIRELARYVGPFSARASQIGRNADRYEREWTAAHPGETPGPALRASWDRRAWAEDRPDKVAPRPGTDLSGRWLAELADLGYRDRNLPGPLAATSVGGLDRDAAAETAVARLGATRSAWNAADIRGEVEQLIAAAGIVADPSVRIELAEDLTFRAMDRCDPLPTLDSSAFPFPEHIRVWTSRAVLDVEADLTARLEARSVHRIAASAGIEAAVAPVRRLDPGQAAAVAALSGDRPLLVIEGAAGAGKTTTLAATRTAFEAQGRRLVVVTPTLKAARVAQAAVGAAAGSAAAFAFAHGWRWNDDGAWTRLTIGQTDPVTGQTYGGPAEGERLRPGDLLVVDEAGMLDQDTARALLTVADECRVRVALLGDRQQLAAVGRGGFLDLAVARIDPGAHLTLEGVHRFTRTVTDADGTVRTVPDTEYADLTLAMRSGEDPGSVFDALLARGQIRIHPDASALQEALADIAADGGSQPAGIVADTREQVAELNAVIRERLVGAERVDDGWAVTTAVGQRIGAGDRVATRRNDTALGVANRDLWVVTAVSARGSVVVTPADAVPPGIGHLNIATGKGARGLPVGYVTDHLELAYASTAHGVQGDTVPVAHLVIGEHTGAASAYVGMTRGRNANIAHLIAADLADAREQWIAVFTRDRADLGPGHAGRLAAAEAARYATPGPLEQVLADLHAAWTAELRALVVLAATGPRLEPLRQLVAAGLNPSGRVIELEYRESQARRDSTRAEVRVRAAEAAVAGDTDRIRTELLHAWARDRIAAAEIARVLLAGPGRFRQRRAAVTHAGQELTAWADAWRPYLPHLPTNLPGIAAAVTGVDDSAGRWKALDDVARQTAVRAHPELVELRAAATAARDASGRATRALEEGRDEQKRLQARFGDAIHTPDPPAALAETERSIAAARSDLAAAREHIQNVRGELARLGQPPERIARERDAWEARRTATLQQRRARQSPPPGHTYPHGRNRSVGRSGRGIGP